MPIIWRYDNEYTVWHIGRLAYSNLPANRIGFTDMTDRFYRRVFWRLYWRTDATVTPHDVGL